MKRLLMVMLAGALTLGLVRAAMAVSNTAVSSITITFSEIAEVAVSGNPPTITINTPEAAGELPPDMWDATTSMNWTSNVPGLTNRKITGSLDGLFLGINLYATVAAPGGDDGISAGELLFAVATTGYDFVIEIENCNVSAQTITFRVSVLEMAAPSTTTSQAVIWTITEAQ